MVQIFKQGGIDVTKEDVLKILTKSPDNYDEDDNGSELGEDEAHIKCNNKMLDSFLNGFIIFKRGKQDSNPGESERPAQPVNESVNNILLKKLKIALTLTSEDIIEILNEAGVQITKGELSALLRKKGHKNYKECGDKYARNFLKGLALKYRD